MGVGCVERRVHAWASCSRLPPGRLACQLVAACVASSRVQASESPVPAAPAVPTPPAPEVTAWRRLAWLDVLRCLVTCPVLGRQWSQKKKVWHRSSQALARQLFPTPCPHCSPPTPQCGAQENQDCMWGNVQMAVVQLTATAAACCAACSSNPASIGPFWTWDLEQSACVCSPAGGVVVSAPPFGNSRLMCGTGERQRRACPAQGRPAGGARGGRLGGRLAAWHAPAGLHPDRLLRLPRLALARPATLTRGNAAPGPLQPAAAPRRRHPPGRECGGSALAPLCLHA